jgi:hypothetical protein
MRPRPPPCPLPLPWPRPVPGPCPEGPVPSFLGIALGSFYYINYAVCCRHIYVLIIRFLQESRSACFLVKAAICSNSLFWTFLPFDDSVSIKDHLDYRAEIYFHSFPASYE